MLYLFIVAIVTIGIAEGLPLIRKKMWKELFTFSSLIGICVILIVLKAFGLSTPFEWINKGLLPVGKSIFKYY